MKLRSLINACPRTLTFEEAEPVLNNINDPSFNNIADSADSTAREYTETVRKYAKENAFIVSKPIEVVGSKHNNYTAAILMSLVSPGNETSQKHAFHNAFQAKNDQAYLAKNMNEYLKTILRLVNNFPSPTRHPNDKFIAAPTNVDRFAKYMAICELYDEILKECGNDPDVEANLIALRDNPKLTFFAARMNIIANPLYAKYYNDGAIYTANDAYFAASRNNPEEAPYLDDLLKNLNIIRDISLGKAPSTQNRVWESHVFLPSDISAMNTLSDNLKEIFKASGYTDDQIEQLIFFDAQGKKIESYKALVESLYDSYDQPHFFAAIPGGPLNIFDAKKAFTRKNVVYGSVSGDPYEHLLRNGFSDLIPTASAAHITYGSTQYAEMEKLLIEYNNLIRSRDFDQAYAAELLGRLDKAADAYLDFKAGQRGRNDDGSIKAKQGVESRRVDFVNSLKDFIADKMVYSNNIREKALRESVYIKFDDPAALAAQAGIPLVSKTATERDQRDALLSKNITDKVTASLNHIISNFERLDANPLDFILIDGIAASARAASSPLNKNNSPTFGYEMIGNALLAGRPVSVRPIDSVTNQLREPVDIKLDRSGFSIKPGSPVPAPNFFVDRFADLGVDRSKYMSNEQLAERNRNSLDAMNFRKSIVDIDKGGHVPAREDYIVPWLNENNKDINTLSTDIPPFALGRMTSVTFPTFIAIGQGMSIEDAMTPGVNHEQKEAIGKEFMDEVSRIHQELLDISAKNGYTGLEALAKAHPELFENVAKLVVPGMFKAIEYLNDSHKNVDFSNISSVVNEKYSVVLNLSAFIFDADQEMRFFRDYFDKAAHELFPEEASAKEAGQKMEERLTTVIAFYDNISKSSKAMHMLASGDVSEHCSGSAAKILGTMALSMKIQERMQNNPDKKLYELFPAQSEIIEILYTVNENIKDTPHAAGLYKLVGELAIKNELKDYVKSEPDAPLSFDIEKLEALYLKRLSAENVTIEANKAAMKNNQPAKNQSARSIGKALKEAEATIANEPKNPAPKQNAGPGIGL